MIDRDLLYHLFETQIVGVLSRIGPDGAPQSAVVGFTETPRKDDGAFKLVIGTNTHSRKAKNIAANPHVSYVIFSEKERLTIQLEGTAELLEAADLGEYRQLIIDKDPVSATYIDKPEQIYIVITPTWVRYSDVSGFPWKVIEESMSLSN